MTDLVEVAAGVALNVAAVEDALTMAAAEGTLDVQLLAVYVEHLASQVRSLAAAVADGAVR